ncbi:hypothetical protein F9B16_41625, partial [Actinomadura montaniterrae]
MSSHAHDHPGVPLAAPDCPAAGAAAARRRSAALGALLTAVTVLPAAVLVVPDATAGVVNRLLLPFGLHHIPNSLIWFVFGSYNGPDGVVHGEINRYL